MRASIIKGVKIHINKSSNYPTPFTIDYIAKGFYIQRTQIVVVGYVVLDDDVNIAISSSPIRMKYPAKDVTVEILY